MLMKRVTICLAAAAVLMAGVLPGARGEVVTINGHKAYTGSVLVRAKREAEAGQGLRALSLPGADSIKAIDTVPGLLVLKREAGLRAQNVRTEEEKAADLLLWIEELKATGQFDYVQPDYQLRFAGRGYWGNERLGFNRWIDEYRRWGDR
jgi:hypothetical protein